MERRLGITPGLPVKVRGRIGAGRSRAEPARDAVALPDGAARQARKRVKMEQRAESMTLWWAERKRRAVEAGDRELWLGDADAQDGREEAGSGGGADG